MKSSIKRSIRKITLGSLIFANALFMPARAMSLDTIVQANQQTEERSDKQRTINKLKLDGGGSFNDASNAGYFRSGVSLLERLEIIFSYDYVGSKERGNEFLRKEARSKERKILIAGIQYRFYDNFIAGLSYDSDGKLGIYSTLLRGGFKHEFHGLYVDYYMGMKFGRVDLQKEKEDVVGSTLKYKMPKSYTNNIIGLEINASYHLPRKYIKEGMFEGPWIGELIVALTFPVTKNIRFGAEYYKRRDYISGLDEIIYRGGTNIKFVFELNDKPK